MLEEQVKRLKHASLEEKREVISNFGIYELRGLARALGVSSPTTKKRDFLIDAIIDLLGSDSAEVAPKSNKGRPFKKLESIDSIMNIISDNNIKPLEIQKTYTYDDIVTFAQEIPNFQYQIEEDPIKKAGVLRIVKKEPYFLDIKDNAVVFVSNEMIRNMGLKSGDFLEVVAAKINKENQYSAKEILSINKISAKEYKVASENELIKIFPSLSRKICEKKVILGARNVAIIEDPMFLENDIIEILREFDSPENSVVFLGLNLCAEDCLLLNSYKNMIKFTTEYGSQEKNRSFDKIIDSINLCERYSRAGKNVVFVIYDLLGLLNSLDMYFANTEAPQIFGHFQQTNVIIEKLISLASAYSNGKDCTEILILSSIDVDDQFLKSQVLKVSRKIR